MTKMLMTCAAFAFAIAGCGRPDGSGSEVQIRDGSDSAREAVALVWLGFDGKKGACTGTLVARNVVLTAAHCLEEFDGNDGRLLEGESIMVDFPIVQEGKVTGYRHVEGEAYWHTSRDILNLTGNDFGLIRLKTPVSDITPIPLASRGPGLGDTMTAVGYGTTNCAFIFSRGENHGTQREKSYRWGGPVYATCPGDSGGPHFNANGEVAAITSGSRIFGDMYPVVANHLRQLQPVLDEWTE